MMGFEPLSDREELSAEFHLLRIFSMRGLVASGLARTPPRVFDGASYRFAIGDDLNDLTRALVGDELTDSQEDWCKEKRAAAPFLVVHIGPTPPASIAAGYVQKRGETTVTHDCFAKERAELTQRERDVIPTLVTTLAIALSGRAHPVTVHPVARELFGKTPSGATVIDLRFSMSGTAYGSAPIDDNELNARVTYAAELRARLRADIAAFYYLGLAENDPLKRFLSFFLFLERYTHSAFQRLVSSADPTAVVNIPPRLARTGRAFARDGRQAAKSPVARFMWCALQAWQDITDADVDSFRRLKVERDKLSHGELTSVDAALADRARDLCSRLLTAEVPFGSYSAAPMRIDGQSSSAP
jgi:hypothetical protein